MKRYTYSIYNRFGNKTKTIVCTSNEPVGTALETYITSAVTPQYLAEINITVEKIEELEDTQDETAKMQV